MPAQRGGSGINHLGAFRDAAVASGGAHGPRAWKWGTRAAPPVVLVQATAERMGSHRLLTVDVFTTRALRGDPVAVVLD